MPTVDILTSNSSCDLTSRSSGDLRPVVDDVTSKLTAKTQSVDWLRCFDDDCNVVSLTHTNTHVNAVSVNSVVSLTHTNTHVNC